MTDTLHINPRPNRRGIEVWKGGELVAKFSSISDCAKEMKWHTSDISKALLHERLCRGYDLKAEEI